MYPHVNTPEKIETLTPKRQKDLTNLVRMILDALTTVGRLDTFTKYRFKKECRRLGISTTAEMKAEEAKKLA